ncbi:5-methyltetrahydropteroyltriglutamate--homocysteine S-methyltransferase, partial [Kingella kingae]|nr:5-methyltetrahydropteroyltriglutamate--homocysteine S-methyltransferase [Kingella kingae]
MQTDENKRLQLISKTAKIASTRLSLEFPLVLENNMNTFHLNGYPRVGAKRELKFAVEAFWKGAKSEAELQEVAAEIRRLNWATQKAAGAD